MFFLIYIVAHSFCFSVMSSICDDKSLREFWVKCTDKNSIYIHPDRLLATLEQKYQSVIEEKYMIDHVKGELVSNAVKIIKCLQVH